MHKKLATVFLPFAQRARYSRCRYERGAPKPSRQVTRESGRGGVTTRLGIGCRLDGVARVVAPGLEARPAAVRALTLPGRLVRE